MIEKDFAMLHNLNTQWEEREVAVGKRRLSGDLVIPPRACGLVLFAHGSGSSRSSTRNRLVATALQQAGLATILLDLLEVEEADDIQNVFDAEMLADRLVDAASWASAQESLRDLPLGVFGASTGAAAALIAASQPAAQIRAVVSRGGRPDLAEEYLPYIHSATLLIVGEQDQEVLRLNQAAYEQLRCDKDLVTIPMASHLFSEPGTLEQVAELAVRWFDKYLESNR